MHIWRLEYKGSLRRRIVQLATQVAYERDALMSQIPDDPKALTGLAFLSRALRGEVPGPPIAALLGFELLEVAEGKVVFGAHPTEAHYSGFGTVHGGYIAALFDCALPCAIATMLESGARCATIDLHTRFFRPITKDTGAITCEGIVIHCGKSHAAAEATLRDTSGQLYAHGTTSCSISRTKR